MAKTKKKAKEKTYAATLYVPKKKKTKKVVHATKKVPKKESNPAVFVSRQYKTEDLILPDIQLPKPCPIVISITKNVVSVQIGQRDCNWDTVSGELIGCGTALVPVEVPIASEPVEGVLESDIETFETSLDITDENPSDPTDEEIVKPQYQPNVNFNQAKARKIPMAKKSNVVAIEEAGKVADEILSEIQPKTDKKILKAAEDAVRKLDNVLSDLHKVAHDFDDITQSIISVEVDPKDDDRLHEASEVTHATATTLYFLAARMSRKYVGKEIANLSDKKRKSLKK